eukprot:scpid98112/ scgid23017/ 
MEYVQLHTQLYQFIFNIRSVTTILQQHVTINPSHTTAAETLPVRATQWEEAVEAGRTFLCCVWVTGCPLALMLHGHFPLALHCMCILCVQLWSQTKPGLKWARWTVCRKQSASIPALACNQGITNRRRCAWDMLAVSCHPCPHFLPGTGCDEAC